MADLTKTSYESKPFFLDLTSDLQWGTGTDWDAIPVSPPTPIAFPVYKTAGESYLEVPIPANLPSITLKVGSNDYTITISKADKVQIKTAKSVKTATTELTVTLSEWDDSILTFEVAGGVDLGDYTVAVRVTTEQGNKLEKSFTVAVRDLLT